MNRRILLSGLLVVVCVAVICGIAVQQAQLNRLRAEERQFAAQLTAAPQRPAPTRVVSPEARSATSPVPSELLRLRSEVTRLTERRRELAGARTENERLCAEVASQSTNAAAGTRPPPGYLRKAEARMVGYNTPEDTIQSFLWALQSHDFTNLLQAFTPSQAKEMQESVREYNRSIEDYFGDAEGVPGMAVVSRKEGPDGPGSLEVEAEVAPNAPHGWIRLRQVGGQWKIDQQF
jgi:hypothetical protein